jgi:hypothetical protein
MKTDRHLLGLTGAAWEQDECLADSRPEIETMQSVEDPIKDVLTSITFE